MASSVIDRIQHIISQTEDLELRIGLRNLLLLLLLRKSEIKVELRNHQLSSSSNSSSPDVEWKASSLLLLFFRIRRLVDLEEIKLSEVNSLGKEVDDQFCNRMNHSSLLTQLEVGQIASLVLLSVVEALDSIPGLFHELNIGESMDVLEAMAALRVHTTYISSFLMFTEMTGVELENWLFHMKPIAMNAARVFIKVDASKWCEDVRSKCLAVNRMASDPQLYQAYFQVLAAPSQHAPNFHVQLNHGLLEMFSDSLVSVLWDKLCQPHSDSKYKHHLKFFYERLRSTKAIFKKHKVLDEKTMGQIGGLMREAGVFIYSQCQTDSVLLSDLGQKFDVFLAQLDNPTPISDHQPPQSTITPPVPTDDIDSDECNPLHLVFGSNMASSVIDRIKHIISQTEDLELKIGLRNLLLLLLLRESEIEAELRNHQLSSSPDVEWKASSLLSLFFRIRRLVDPEEIKLSEVNSLGKEVDDELGNRMNHSSPLTPAEVCHIVSLVFMSVAEALDSIPGLFHELNIGESMDVLEAMAALRVHTENILSFLLFTEMTGIHTGVEFQNWLFHMKPTAMNAALVFIKDDASTWCEDVRSKCLAVNRMASDPQLYQAYSQALVAPSQHAPNFHVEWKHGLLEMFLDSLVSVLRDKLCQSPQHDLKILYERIRSTRTIFKKHKVLDEKTRGQIGGLIREAGVFIYSQCQTDSVLLSDLGLKFDVFLAQVDNTTPISDHQPPQSTITPVPNKKEKRRWGGEVFHVDPAAGKRPYGGDWQVLQAPFFYARDFLEWYSPPTYFLANSIRCDQCGQDLGSNRLSIFIFSKDWLKPSLPQKRSQWD